MFEYILYSYVVIFGAISIIRCVQRIWEMLKYENVYCLRVYARGKDTREHILMNVVQRGNMACISYLQKQYDVPDQTMMCIAVWMGNIEYARYLWDICDVVVNERTVSRAATGGHLACLKFLLQECSAPVNYYAVSDAAEHGKMECLVYLLERNAPVTRSAVTEAARAGQLDCMRYLLEKCDVRIRMCTAMYAYEYAMMEFSMGSLVGFGCIRYLAEKRYSIFNKHEKDVVVLLARQDVYISDEWCLVPWCGKTSEGNPALCREHAQRYITTILEANYAINHDVAKLLVEFV